MAGTQTSLRYYWGLAKETTKGTPVAPTTFPRWLDGANLGASIKAERVMEGDGSRDGAFTLKNLQEYAPSIPCYPRPIEAGMLIAAAFGTGCDTKTGAGPYTHTMVPTNTPDWYAIEVGLLSADYVQRVADGALEELTIEGQAGKPVKFTAKFAAMVLTRGSSAATVTQEAGLPMLFHGGTFSVDGSGSTYVEKFKLTYKNVIDKPQTGAVTVADLIWGRRTLDIEYTLLFQNDTLFRKMFLGSTSGTTDVVTVSTGAMDFTLLQAGVATSGYSVELQVPQIGYHGDEPTPSLDGKAFRYNVKGYAEHGSSPLITAIAVNSLATAY